MPLSSNPLLDDRDIDFLLYEVHRIEELCALPAFSDHSRGTFDLVFRTARRFARDVLYPTYRETDAAPPVYEGGRVRVHRRMREIYAPMVELGLLSASRPPEVGGQNLPLVVSALATAYLTAANASATGFMFLTAGAAHLLEAFGSDELKRAYMVPMYSGEWTGTMALTEPQAGSSLSDVMTLARPTADGHYLLNGTKIFISGGDHDVTENVVNLTLARIEGAPPGIKGVSLFAVPRRRLEGGELVDNDVRTAGMIHKIGWRALPSVILNLGEAGDCRGWLVGEPHKGISYMFQMMNEARISVGVGAAATASVAYHEALAYARTRPQGRGLSSRDPRTPQIPIIEHADVRRMLLRQKAIVEGSLCLATATARYSDIAAHGATPEARHDAKELLDLLTPVTKSFPAEHGFEANVLALQVHGGYGYSSEYLPEAWLRDQKLNSIHEGTTGIQALDLLGRKVVAGGGGSLKAFLAEVARAVAQARDAGVPGELCDEVERASAAVAELTVHLGGLGLEGNVEGMLLHASDYLELFSIVTIGWQWLLMATAARAALSRGAEPRAFYEGKLCAARYWIATEVPRVHGLAALCRSGEDSYLRMQPDWF